MARVAIAEFGIIQKGLALASVAVFEADASGTSTGTLATLYQDATTSGTRSNPQTLDSNGKLADPCFVDTVVVAAISNITDTTARAIRKITINPLEYLLPVTSAEIATAIIADSVTAAVAAAASADAAEASEDSTAADAATASAAATSTAADVVLTHADAVSTHADTVTTAAYAASALVSQTAAAASAASFTISGTSVSTVSVGTGSKTFATQTGISWVSGATRVRAATADGSKVMEGLVTAYSAGSVTLNVDYTAGSSSASAWNLTTTGTRGAAGSGSGDVVAANFGTEYSAGYGTLRTNIGLAIGTNVQAYDAELAALAGLTSAADKVPYFTGSGTAAVASFTGVARTLVAQTTQALMRTTGLGSTTVGDAVFIAANAAAARTAIGTVIGTDVQAYDAELAALAGLVSAASKIPYFTGSGTAGLLSLDTDNTLAANSDTAVATQKAVKGYVAAHGGGQMQMTAFLTSDTFTTSANITSATRFKFTIIGGGGGGGGTTGTNSAAGGGGAGATCIYEVSGLSPSTGYTVTVGAGGTAGAAAGNGGPGGTSSVVIGGTTPTAAGGAGGTGTSTSNMMGVGGAGGIASSGTINDAGGYGFSSSIGISGVNNAGGNGGCSSRGGGGGGAVGASAGAGIVGQAYGSGGGGSFGATQLGGAGKAGIVIVEWIE